MGEGEIGETSKLRRDKEIQMDKRIDHVGNDKTMKEVQIKPVETFPENS